jgi:hypothetical protein
MLHFWGDEQAEILHESSISLLTITMRLTCTWRIWEDKIVDEPLIM